MSSAEVKMVGGDQERDEQPIVDEPSKQEEPKSVDFDDNYLVDEDENDDLMMLLPSGLDFLKKTCQCSATKQKIISEIEPEIISEMEPKINCATEESIATPGFLAEIKRQSRKSGKREDSCPNLCKLAENFCLGPLDNLAFFEVFNEYTKRRRRLSYTELFEDNNKEIEPAPVSVLDLFLHYGNLQRMDEFQRFDF